MPSGAMRPAPAARRPLGLLAAYVLRTEPTSAPNRFLDTTENGDSMSRVESDQPLLPSVLDRLIDLEPKVSSEPPLSRARGLAQIKQAVQRDLEWLLNSRRILADLPADLRHVRQSLLTYGMADFTTASLNNPSDQQVLRRALVEAIQLFEPRLMQVEVTLVEGHEFDRALRFRIDALLRIEPQPEPISFDSVLQLNTKAFVVQSE